MSTQFIVRRPGGPISSTGSHAGIGVDSRDDLLKYRVGTSTITVAADVAFGAKWYVSSTIGSAANAGHSAVTPLATIQAAVTAASAGDLIFIAPGAYDETVTIARAKSNLTLVGVGGRGSVYIDPSTEDTAGMLIHADDVTLINIGIAAEDETSAAALTVTGSRVRAYGCKIEGGADQVIVGPGTDAQITADTRGKGADCRFEDCEICWGTDGIVVTSSDYGACTQLVVKDCHLHNLMGDCIAENDVGALGAGRNIWILDNTIDVGEDGTAPSKFIDMNTVGYTGLVKGNTFATTVHAAAKIALAAGVLYVDNFAQAEGPATGGGTAGRPD